MLRQAKTWSEEILRHTRAFKSPLSILERQMTEYLAERIRREATEVRVGWAESIDRGIAGRDERWSRGNIPYAELDKGVARFFDKTEIWREIIREAGGWEEGHRENWTLWITFKKIIQANEEGNAEMTRDDEVEGRDMWVFQLLVKVWDPRGPSVFSHLEERQRLVIACSAGRSRDDGQTSSRSISIPR